MVKDLALYAGATLECWVLKDLHGKIYVFSECLGRSLFKKLSTFKYVIL